MDLSGDPCGGGSKTTPLGALPVMPGAGGGGNCSGYGTGNPPPPPPSGRPQGPDPLPGRRVSIRPQPTRVPLGKVMALSSTLGGGLASAVAWGPTLELGGCGMAGGTATAALLLSLAPSATGNAPRGSPPPPPPGVG